MSILITGMEMPESCFDCPFMYGRKYCRANSKIEFNDPDYSELKGRYDGCPLVHVPPHGRLGDLDAVAAEIQNAIDNMEYSYPYLLREAQSQREHGMVFAEDIVRDAPTIIPAEPAEEDE